MQFQDAVERTGGDSVGGQLIVHKDGVNILVGRHVQGNLVVEETDAAQAIMAGIEQGRRRNVEGGVQADPTAPHKPRGRKPAAAAAAAAAAAIAAAAPDPADDAETGMSDQRDNEEDDTVHHDVVVADETVTADALGDRD